MRLFCLQLEASCLQWSFLLLTVDNFSFFTYNWSFFAYSFSFSTYSWSFFAYSGRMRLLMALRDCKQRSSTVSKKAPTVSKKASPNSLCMGFFLYFEGQRGPIHEEFGAVRGSLGGVCVGGFYWNSLCLCIFGGLSCLDPPSMQNLRSPGQSAEMCRRIFVIFTCGGFCKGFSWRIILGTFFHEKKEEKSGDKIQQLKNENLQKKFHSPENRPWCLRSYFSAISVAFLRVQQKECGKRSSITFFGFRDAFGHFSVTFSDASVTRRAPDYSSNLCPPKIWSIWLFKGCFGAFYTRKRTGSRPKTPLKKSYRSYLRRAQIRWVIWRSSSDRSRSLFCRTPFAGLLLRQGDFPQIWNNRKGVRRGAPLGNHFQTQHWYAQARIPKGPFRTKNATALNSVVFYYRRSFLLSVAICCLISF